MSRDPLADVGGLNGLLADEVESYGRAIAERDLARDAAVCLEQELAAAEAENKKLRGILGEALPIVSYVSAGRGYVGVEVYPDASARIVNALIRDALDVPS